MHTFDPVHRFLETVLQRNQTSNILRSSMSVWYRYYDFLRIILVRYEEANTAYMTATEQHRKIFESSGSRLLTPEDEEWYQRGVELQSKLHLEIESFYIFARILLDRIADTFAFYFSHPWEKAGSTHSKLTSWFRKICRETSLAGAPDELHTLMGDLNKRIGNYRNNFIEHLSEPRLMHATTWGADKKTQVGFGIMYPSDQERDSALINTKTGDISELLGAIDQYIAAMIRFFEANSEKSVLITNVPKHI
jgi:hypothetical protein